MASTQPLTKKQYSLLTYIDEQPRTASTLAELTDVTYAAIHMSLRRMEDREFVRRMAWGTQGSKWELTALGRKFMAEFENAST